VVPSRRVLVRILAVIPSRRVLTRIIALVLVMSTAIADARSGEPIVLISSDAAFAGALDDALVPAGMEVVSLGMLAAPASAELTARSRELADQQRATATVWLMPAAAGATLVAYDRQNDRLLVRDLPYALPLSAPQAAEAARMVRTMLRALRVTTESDLPPPTVMPPAGPPAPVIAAIVGLGAWFPAPGADRAFAGSLTIAWRPHGFGAAVSGTLAPRADIMAATFTGYVRDVVIAAEARKALRFAPDVYVTPGAGVAIHTVTLNGSFGGGALTSRRYNPAVRVGVTAGYALPGGLEVGAAVSADLLLQRQKYEGVSEEILVVPRFQVVTGVVVGLRL
jgi:hypothetical protein